MKTKNQIENEFDKCIDGTIKLWYTKSTLKRNGDKIMRTTMLLPTTLDVNKAITLSEALSILDNNNVSYEVKGQEVDGMYVADNKEVVKEKLVPIAADISAQALAVMFKQECILETDEVTAQLVAQDGSLWANFTQKTEMVFATASEAELCQYNLAMQHGGASRQGTKVWAWTA